MILHHSNPDKKNNNNDNNDNIQHENLYTSPNIHTNQSKDKIVKTNDIAIYIVRS